METYRLLPNAGHREPRKKSDGCLRFFPLLAALLFVFVLFYAAHAYARRATEPNFKVAFVADMGVSGDAEDVLRLIRRQGADMVLHQGDMGYDEANPAAPIRWEDQLNQILGENFPYFASVGNHDLSNWPLYRRLLVSRLKRVPGAECVGKYGVKAACRYKGLFFILSGAGTFGANHYKFIPKQLAQDDSIWRVCSWHKNQRRMQVGYKSNEVGWLPYEECRLRGAIIATGHEHSYARSKTLSNTEFQIIDPNWPERNRLGVGPGSTFVFVSGIGGDSIREQDRCLPSAYPYGCKGVWGKIYTATQGAKYGALFIEFHVDGDPRKARGQFVNVYDEVIDDFTIVAFEPKPERGIIEGIVKDSATGEQLAGVVVQVDTGQWVNTNRDGQYVLSDIPAGGRTVKAFKKGYLTQARMTKVRRHLKSNVDFTLQR